MTAALLVCLSLLCERGLAQSEGDTDRPVVTAIRFWSMPDVTRIAIESTAEFHFRSDRLRNPERIFFDLVGARTQLGRSRGQNVIGVNDLLVRQIRVAETQRGVTRVVLDVGNDVDFTTSQLSNPDRLIIEVRRLGSEQIANSQLASTAIAAPEKSAVDDRSGQRLARLDFSFVAERRERALRAAQPIFFDPPSSVDSSLLSDSGRGMDPLGRLRLSSVGPVLPPRVTRTTHSSPGILAKTTPSAAAMPPREPASESLETSRLAAVGSRTVPPSLPEEIGLPAKRTGQGDTMTRVLGLKLGRVVIDPGHGGHDAGTSGPDGLHEKDVVLDVSKRLGVLIQERLGSEVVFTRTDDTFIPLSRRTDIANEIKADLFLSIHVNSSPIRAVAGVETYYLNFTTSKTALETAMRENAGADRNVSELQDLLKKIALKDKADESREFASRIQNSLCTLEGKSARTRDRGVKRAPFVVLIGASMPSVLAEVGFISNARDESMMRKPEYRQRIAEALYKGVAAYANSLSHFQVAQQSSKIVKSETARR